VRDEAALPLEAALAELALDRVDGAVAAHVHAQAPLPLAHLRAHLADVPLSLQVTR
jgi:hypothetical protein